MSTKAETEQLQATSPSGWRPAPELAPSAVRPDEPSLARIIFVVSLFLIFLGALLWWRVAPSYPFLGILGILFVVVGVGGVLYHAVRDGEQQVRRMYMTVAYVFLGGGILLCLIPAKEHLGGLYLGLGLIGQILGLLFLLAFVRHETEAKLRDTAVYIIGGLGVFMGLIGFVYGNISIDFLLPYGLLVMLLGLFYWWAFVGMKGTETEIGYRAAQGMGLLGLVGFAVALSRSTIPEMLAKWGWINAAAPYLMPAGLLLMICGACYMLLSAFLWSDVRLIVLTRREIEGIFFSPIAYIVLFGFTVIAWQLFGNFVLESLWQDEPFRGIAGSPRQQVEPIVANYIIAWFPIICVIFVVPVLTMRLLSEEHRTGTLEVLLTAPLDEITVVTSKFLAAFLFFTFIWLPWGLYLVALRVEGGQEFDYRPILGFFIALIFTGAGFVSMGLFFSSLTRNQVAAAILTFVGMLFLTFIFFPKRSWPEGNIWRIALEHISYIDLWINSLRGKLAPRDLIYHFSAAVFWLFLTVKVLESRRWR
jgi:hypothetical protein